VEEDHQGEGALTTEDPIGLVQLAPLAFGCPNLVATTTAIFSIYTRKTGCFFPQIWDHIIATFESRFSYTKHTVALFSVTLSLLFASLSQVNTINIQ
jgi:hypothetical protein